MGAGRFIAWIAAWSLALWCALAAATVYLDPGRALARTSTCAPHQSWKPAAFERSGARTVYLGTSRVALGIDATSAPTAFNLALPDSTMARIAGQAERIIARGSVDAVVVGIDYTMFVVDEPRARATDRATLSIDGWPSRAQMRGALDVMCVPYEIDPRSGTVWGRGSGGAFADSLHLTLVDYSRCLGGACDPAYRAHLEAFRRLLRQAARSKVRLDVFTNPLPALHLEGIRLAGAGAQFERWKRDLATIARQEGAAPVRDFAVFAPEVGEGRATPNGFLDTTHYTHALGRVVQGRLASDARAGLFGAELRVETLGDHLAHDRAAREAWAAGHRDELVRLQAATTRLRPAALAR